nr:AraC family transcriptional regulator [Burkholderia guangdongensis]
MADDGVAPADVLAGSGLDAAALRSTDARISYRQVAAVFGNAVRLAPDPTAALRAGTRMHLTAYGMYGYGLLSSPTREQMNAFLVKYNSVMGPVASPISFNRDGHVGVYRYEVLLSHDPRDALFRFALEFAFSAHLTMSRDLWGDAFAFESLHMSYPAPAHADVYADFFECPIEFGRPNNEIVVGAQWAEGSGSMPDPITHAVVGEMCQSVLSELEETAGMATTVRRALIEQMPWRYPDIESMASKLSMHPRTLRRKLEAEGTTYRDILADVRRRLAVEYLRKTRMTTEEIASRLGYSDAANFRHAFARWTGKSPSEYRVG